MTKPVCILPIARKVLLDEAEALTRLSDRLSDSFEQAVDVLLNHPGKTIISGIGKSGRIAQKMASTLSSTGTPAIFMHAAEAMHGDLGIYQAGDPSILLSKSGSTAELLHIIPTLKACNSTIISIVSNPSSPLAEQSDIVLDASITKEADPLGLVPTTSALVTLALGDALACSLMHARGFQTRDFARCHPAGQLGRNLLMKTREVMKPIEKIGTLTPNNTLKEAVITMTKYPHGAACIVDDEDKLSGILTDGDLRRALNKHDNIQQLSVRDVMTVKPTIVYPDISLSEAVKIMEDRSSQISVLPVVEPATHKCLGLLRIHDIYQPNLL